MEAESGWERRRERRFSFVGHPDFMTNLLDSRPLAGWFRAAFVAGVILCGSFPATNRAFTIFMDDFSDPSTSENLSPGADYSFSGTSSTVGLSPNTFSDLFNVGTYEIGGGLGVFDNAAISGTLRILATPVPEPPIYGILVGLGAIASALAKRRRAGVPAES